MIPLTKDAIVGFAWPISDPVPLAPPAPKAERTPTDTPEAKHLRDALAAIPNADVSYDEWFRIACAVHYATEGQGLDVFREWSAKSAKHDDEFLENRVWPYLGVTSGEVITERSLFALAAQHGWQDPSIADDFEVVEPTEEEHEQEPLPMFTPVRVADFATGRPMEWLVKNVLPRAELGMVFGASGSGKSFLLIDMACSIARGVPWRDRTVQKGRVCYVVAEGAAGFRKRVDAYCLHHEIDIAELDIYIIGDAPNLNEKAHVKALIAGIKSAGQFDLIVLDTLAAVSAGADENSAKEMGVILDRARTIGKAAGAMTLLVHHAGKQADRGARGSTAIRGRVDVEIEVVRADNDRAASVSKLRDQEDGASFGFKLQTIPVGMDDEGGVIDSCVVEHTVNGPAASSKAAPRGKAEIAIHGVVLDLMDVGDGPTVDDVLSAYASLTPHDPQSGRDTRRQVAMRALRSLIDKGVFKAEGVRVRLPGGDDDDENSAV